MAKKTSTSSRNVGRRDIASKDKSSLPIYHQLYTILRQDIADGVYPADQPLPTEMVLSANFKVSRVTVRRALDMLEREGLVARRQGIGTFAIQHEESATANRLSGLIENLITLGIETTAELLSYEEITPPPQVAKTLKLGPDELCIAMRRLRKHKDRPVSLTNVYIPESYRAIVPKDAIDNRPVVRILELAGIIATNAEQTISAVAADEQAATWLNIATGSPVIRLRRTVFDSTGKPIVYQQSLYNPDRYEYYMLLSRDNSSARPQWRHLG